MSRQAKIIWTLTEQSDWYAAFVLELGKRNIPRPVSAAHLREVMQSAREALKVIKVERRRDMQSVDSIRGELAQRLIDNGIFPRDYLESLRIKRKASALDGAVDPRDAKITELTGQLEAEKADFEEAQLFIKSLQDQIAVLENQPTPAQLLQRFVAETFAMALNMHDAAGKPAGVQLPPKEPADRSSLPAFERERRKDPVGFTAAAMGAVANGKPKFALIADFVGSDKSRIQAEAGPVADLRYLDASAKFNGLKLFNANGGRIVLWADHCPRAWEGSLGHIGVTFHRHRGSLPSLVQHIKDTVNKFKGVA